MQRRCDVGYEVRFPQLPGGKIDAHADRTLGTTVLPRPCLLAGLDQHPLTDGNDKAYLLRKFDKRLRLQQSAPWMTPSQERFHRHDVAR